MAEAEVRSINIAVIAKTLLTRMILVKDNRVKILNDNEILIYCIQEIRKFKFISRSKAFFSVYNPGDIQQSH